MKAGEHPNLIRKEEYLALNFLALDYAIAKCLFNYLAKVGVRKVNGTEVKHVISKNNEPWTRYFFRQFIEGL
jgi:hypothetical protein